MTQQARTGAVAARIVIAEPAGIYHAAAGVSA